VTSLCSELQKILQRIWWINQVGRKQETRRQGHVSQMKTWRRKSEMSQAWMPERASSTFPDYHSIMEGHNGILLLQKTSHFWDPQHLFKENHFFCYQNSLPVFCDLTPPHPLRCCKYQNEEEPFYWLAEGYLQRKVSLMLMHFDRRLINYRCHCSNKFIEFGIRQYTLRLRTRDVGSEIYYSCTVSEGSFSSSR
jgi:hypothetical protein